MSVAVGGIMRPQSLTADISANPIQFNSTVATTTSLRCRTMYTTRGSQLMHLLIAHCYPNHSIPKLLDKILVTQFLQSLHIYGLGSLNGPTVTLAGAKDCAAFTLG